MMTCDDFTHDDFTHDDFNKSQDYPAWLVGYQENEEEWEIDEEEDFPLGVQALGGIQGWRAPHPSWQPPQTATSPWLMKMWRIWLLES
jgi:hypothetical protein